MCIRDSTKTGKEYANVMLADKTGQIDSKIWDLNSGGIAEFDVNDYVAVTGQDVYKRQVITKPVVGILGFKRFS